MKKKLKNKWRSLAFIGKDIKVYVDGVETDNFPLEFWVREPIEVIQFGERINLFNPKKQSDKTLQDHQEE